MVTYITTIIECLLRFKEWTYTLKGSYVLTSIVSGRVADETSSPTDEG